MERWNSRTTETPFVYIYGESTIFHARFSPLSLKLRSGFGISEKKENRKGGVCKASGWMANTEIFEKDKKTKKEEGIRIDMEQRDTTTTA